jgi:flotillin
MLIVFGGRQKIIDPATGGLREHWRICRKGRAFVRPILEKAERLSLNPITVPFALRDAFTSLGTQFAVSGVAEVKVMEDDLSLRRAADVWISKTPDQIAEALRPIFEGYTKVVLGDDVLVSDPRDRKQVAQSLQSESTHDLEVLGLEVVSLTVEEIRETSDSSVPAKRKGIARGKSR